MEQNQEVVLSFEQVEEILNIVTSSAPNKEDLNKAYLLIKQFSKSPKCIVNYLHHIKTNQKQGCRQLAAVLLSKKIMKHWENLEEADKKVISAELLTAITAEKTYLVAKSISMSISKILIANLRKQLGTDSSIDENSQTLFSFVMTDPTSYDASQSHLFEVNLFVISELLEECEADQLISLLPKIKLVVNLALTSGTNKMKENATRCLGNLVRNYDLMHITDLKFIIPKVFESIESFSEETVAHIYETLCDFSMKSLKFFEDSFEGIILVTYKLLQSEMFQISTKMIFAEMIQMVAECKKKVFTNNKSELLVTGVHLAFKLACEENDIEGSDDSEISLFEIGNRLLGVFSITIKSNTFYPIAMESITKILANINANEHQRKASIAAIGVIAEGCEEKYRDNMDEIVDALVKSFMTDKSIAVKRAAVISIDSIIEHFGDFMADYHDKIIPMLYYGLSESDNEKIIETCLIELNYFVRTLDFELEDYIHKFVPLLVNIILNSKSHKLRSESLFALSSFINQGEESVALSIDYRGLIGTCSAIIQHNTLPEENELRGHALRCIGEIASKVKINVNEISVFSAVALEFIKNKTEYVLVEAGFGYLGLISSIFDFDKDLDSLVEIAMGVITDSSGVHAPGKQDEYGFDSDSEPEEGEVNAGGNYVNEDFINAKCATILAVTLIFESSAKRIAARIAEGSMPTNDLIKTTFLRHLETLINSFEELWDNVDDNINYELIAAYKSLVISTYKVDPALGKAFWIQTVFFKFEEFIKETDDKQLVTNICEAIYLVINELGHQTFTNAQNQPTNLLTRILDITVLILNGKLSCQVKNDEDDDEQDYEEKLLQAATDIYLILAEKLGDDFHPYFTTITDIINKYLGPKKSEYDKSLALGVYAEVLKYCKVSTKFYAEYLYKNMSGLIEKLTKNSDDLFRNIAYLLGILYESDPTVPFLVEKSQESVKLLEYIYGQADRMGKDNAISALCRIAISAKLDTSSDFFETIFKTVINNTPLVNDHFENDNLIKFWIYFVNSIDFNSPQSNSRQISTFSEYLLKSLNLIKHAVLHEKKCDINPSTFESVKQILHRLPESEKNKVMAYLDTTAALEKEKFIKKLA